MTGGRTVMRVRMLALLAVLMFAALSTRLWYLQVLAGSKYGDMARENSIRFVDVPAPRGEILDTKGRTLVGNRLSIEVTVNRQQLGGRADAVLFNLAQRLGVSASKLRERLLDPRYYAFTPVPVAFDVRKNDAVYIGEHPDEFRGVTVTEVPVRTYPYGDLAAHVLGYIGGISPEQLKDPAFAEYDENALVGKAGVEQWYERWLQGTPGREKIRVDASGKNLGVIGSLPPASGDDLMLSVDADVQQLAEDSLTMGMDAVRGFVDSSGRLKANAGAVVVMDPNTGAIVAMASSPAYDPALFVGGIAPDQYEKLKTDPDKPLLDRAIQGLYPPGSAYKPFVAASVLRTGVASTGASYPCDPEFTAPGDTSGTVFHNWTDQSLPPMTLAEALIASCDTVFYPFGWDYWLRYFHTGDETLQRDLRDFGFGKSPLIDLPGSQPGRVPDAEWVKHQHAEYPRLFPTTDWRPGDYINMSIGQGDTLVTPLQIARAYSALATGRLCVPHVADSVRKPKGGALKPIEPPCRKLPFGASQLDYIRNALTEVPTRGTAAPAFQPTFPFTRVWVAGKTGTAEVPGKVDYSWFASMVGSSPNHPDYVVVTLVEQGGHGSTTAAPITRRVIEGLYGLRLSDPRPAGQND